MHALGLELWPDPVETQKLLQKVSAKIRKYIVLRPEAVIATALWTMTAWAHEGATHSPILAAISVEPDSGKSTLLGVLRFLVPKPFVSVEPTGPSVYRTVDREHPTLIIDEADDLAATIAARMGGARHEVAPGQGQRDRSMRCWSTHRTD